MGLQKKNVILRNELRHLKRSLGGDTPAQHPPPSRGYNTCVLPSHRNALGLRKSCGSLDLTPFARAMSVLACRPWRVFVQSLGLTNMP